MVFHKIQRSTVWISGDLHGILIGLDDECKNKKNKKEEEK